MIKALDKWLLPYLTQPRSKTPIQEVVLTICDHYEPFHHSDKSGALKRLAHWREIWPQIVSEFKDSNAIGPRYSFFYPIEQYDKQVIDQLQLLCEESHGETEVHLHHDQDDAENLCQVLFKGVHQLADHGLLSRDPTGKLRYAFIHGNWALDDSDPRGKGCGVKGELQILKSTGCYVDMTMPSAPHPTQAPIINSIYYAQSHAAGCSHHHAGHLVVSGECFDQSENDDQLLMVQGPLGLNWNERKWGILPRVENGDITQHNPPTLSRFKNWLQFAPRLKNREEVVFIKLHTHGAIERNSDVILGEAMRRFYRDILAYTSENQVRLHFATAREMSNIILGLETDTSSEVHALRNLLYRSNR